MNPVVKSQWLAALRGGEYQQCAAQLRAGNRFCCLGVLCDLHSKETGTEWDCGRYCQDAALLPPEVVQWSGLTERSPYAGDHSKPLTAMNDSGTPFPEIADLIERHL